MQPNNAVQPERPRQLPDQVLLTNDFIHFVIHVAAKSNGGPCEVCKQSGPIRYA
jgi:hypothetical protein